MNNNKQAKARTQYGLLTQYNKHRHVKRAADKRLVYKAVLEFF
jgi:hypothetical protein